MKKLFSFLLFGLILLTASCNSDNMKQYYDTINEHNGCVVTLGKDYNINRLDHYYVYDNYDLEEYDYICFAINAEDMENITTDDLNELYSILMVVPTFAMLYLQNFENYNALENNVFSTQQVNYYNKNITLMLRVAWSNGKTIFSKPGDTNEIDFKSNVITEFAWEIGQYETSK